MEIQNSVLGRVQVARTCRACGGTGEVIKDPCEHCQGDGRVRKRKTLKVNIPAGISDGMRIRMSGKGEVGPGGGPAGDLYIDVETEEHPYFLREGDDLHVTVRVPDVDAALGAEVPIGMLDGSTHQLNIQPGTQPEAAIRVPGLGMPHMRSEQGQFGSLIAHVEVVIPQQLTKTEQHLYEQLRAEQKEAATVGTKASDGQGLFARLRSKFGR